MLSKKHWRVARFVISGGITTVVNFSLLYSFTEFLHVWYLASSLVGLAGGFITSFILQKFWTFENRALHRVHIQFQLHVLLGLFNVAANTISLYALVEYMHVWYLLAQFINGACLAVFNYFIYRHYIFPHEQEVVAHTPQE